MTLKIFKSAPALIATAVIVVVGILEITHAPFAQRVEWMTYDLRVKLAQNYPGSSSLKAPNLGFVEINDQTIADVNSGQLGPPYGLYWPRSVYGRALEELSRQGAKAVAFDILFSERRPDLDSYTLPDGTQIASDDYFAQVLKKSGNAILAAEMNAMPNLQFRTNCWQIGSITTERDADGVLRRDKAFQDHRVWHWIVEQMAAEYLLDLTRTEIKPNEVIFYKARKGKTRADDTVVFKTDKQGYINTTDIVNPVPPGVPSRFFPYTYVRSWSMGIVLAANYLKLDLDSAKVEPELHRIRLEGENGLKREIAIDGNGYFYIDWSITPNDSALRKGSLTELLQAPIERERGKPVDNFWKDKLVIIGSTATGNELTDMGATPLAPNTFLMSKHWNIANSIITDHHVTWTPPWVNLILIVVVGIFSAWVAWVTTPLRGFACMVGMIAAYFALASILYSQMRLWIPVFLPMICVWLTNYLAIVTYRVRVEQTERTRMKGVFSKMVAPAVVNELLAADTLELGGTRREITIYFADVRGFTKLTDETQTYVEEYIKHHNLTGAEKEIFVNKQAAETLETVSTYLGRIADVVTDNKGTLDKYIGDCVMAFWGAPLPDPQHALNCVRAAIQAQRVLAELNVQRGEANKLIEQENAVLAAKGSMPRPLHPQLSMGSGINTGYAIVGLMGSDAHQVSYTVFGREVNLASRLEGVSGHGRIIIGEGTYKELLRDDPKLAATCVALEPVPVKGFRDLVPIYEVPWK